MRLSIHRFAHRFTPLLALTIGTALFAGAWLVHDRYRLAESRFVADSEAQLRQTAVLIANQVQFYRRILQDLAHNPRLADLIEFSDEAEIVDWAQRAVGFLPGSLGAALATPGGEIIGDPPSMRVGAACIDDVRSFSRSGETTHLPPFHHGVPGIEHFDLYQKIASHSGNPAGILIISFQARRLQRLIAETATAGQRYRLLASDGNTIAEASRAFTTRDTVTFRMPVPETGWTLALTLPERHHLAPASIVAIVGLSMLALLSAIVLYISRNLLGYLTADLRHLHQALLDAGNGTTDIQQPELRLGESVLLLSEIETVAKRLETHELARDDEAHRDPLSGLYDRRYFDILLTHELLQSERAPGAYLALIDINDFAGINDRFGHATGDALLQATARFLLRRVRKTDTVARLEGDCFGLLLQNMDTGAVETWLQHLLAAFARLEQPQLQVQEDVAPSTIAVGVTRLDGHRVESVDRLLGNARDALHAAKARKSEGSVIVVHGREPRHRSGPDRPDTVSSSPDRPLSRRPASP